MPSAFGIWPRKANRRNPAVSLLGGVGRDQLGPGWATGEVERSQDVYGSQKSLLGSLTHYRPGF